MALGRSNTSVKAADVEKLLPLKKRRVEHILPVPPPNRNPNSTLILILTQRDPDYHQNLTGFSVTRVPPFHRILLKPFE